MNKLLIPVLALLVAGCSEKTVNEPEPTPERISVDRERIIEAAEGEGLSHGRTYSEQRFSPLAQVRQS